MKRFWLLLMATMGGFLGVSQKSQQQIIEDSVYGWFKVYNYKASEYKPQTASGRTFSPRQKSFVDSFVNWIQASYIPKGGIGDVKRKLISPRSEYISLESLPQAYGATAFTWSMEVNKSTGKHDIIRETEIPFGIFANEVIGMPIHDLCTPSQFLFTRPGSGDDRFRFVDASLRERYDITRLPQLKKYITFFSEASNYDRNAGLVDVVLLSKDNRMPFITVTKGQYLDILPAAIERAYQKELDYAEKNWPTGAIHDKSVQEVAERKERRMSKIRLAKERYKNRLEETATVVSAQPDILLENEEDIFEGNGGATQKYTIYKVDPEMAAKCKDDMPQWVVFTWNWAADDPKLVHLHESIINNFNFDYAYDFFFNPEKVKGKPYKPLRDPYPVTVNNKVSLSTKAKNVIAEKGVIYYEDFSSTALNQKPWNWYTQLSIAGVAASVNRVEGLEGNWLVLKGNRGTPLQLGQPLPNDFTLSMDVAVPKGFTWGAKGLELILSQRDNNENDQATLRFKMRPGFDGRDGFSVLEKTYGNQQVEQMDGTASGFSNNLPINLVKVVLRKTGDQVSVTINGKSAGTLSKPFPAVVSLNHLVFVHSRSDADTEKYYISNIRIDSK